MEIKGNGGKVIRGYEERVFVSVRLRPLNDEDVLSNDALDWECINDDTIIFKRSMHPTAYTFDRVFDTDCSTREVYEHGAKDVAISAIHGINSTVLAYGQKSSGKTYTMTGITEYAIADIYEYIKKHSKRDFILKFSAMEIYSESIGDVLASDRTPLRLLDDPERGTIVEKLTEEILRDRDHANELLSICQARRNVREASLTETNSKTHLIIRLMIESSSREFLGRNNASSLTANVNFVDLAGPELAPQTLSGGRMGLKEVCCMDRSLHTLESVIHKLSKDPNGQIPYGDAKLTRILQTSLGGNARAAIICTISPARNHVDQSRSTLVFAGHAKEVRTKARVNVVVSDITVVSHLQKELARLETELKNERNGFGPSHYYAMLREKDGQIEKLEKEIKDLILQRDIAQSQVKEFIRILGADASSMSQIGQGQYPHLRVQISDSDIEKQEGYPSVDPILDIDNPPFSNRLSSSSTEDHVKVPFLDRGSLNSSVSDLSHAWPETEEWASRASPPSAKEHVFNKTVDNAAKKGPFSNEGPGILSPALDEKECDFSTIQFMNKDSFGGRSLNLARSSSFQASVASDSSSLWFKVECGGGDTPAFGLEGESEDFEGKSSALGPDENAEERYYGKDCRSVSVNAPGVKLDGSDTKFLDGEGGTSCNHEMMNEKVEQQSQEELDNRQEMVVEPKVDKSPEKNVKVGRDPIEDECRGLTSWPVEFKRLQREIIELWHSCNVSLVHRTYFFLLFQGDPSDAIYLEVEMRRMKFLRDKFMRGDKAVVDGRTLTLSSSAKALRQERRALSEQMSKRFTEQEREKLFIEWGIGLNTKLRRVQLAHLVWFKTDDINHITESAILVAKLVGLIEPGQATNREMLGVNFTYKCSTGISTFKRSLVSLI